MLAARMAPPAPAEPAAPARQKTEEHVEAAGAVSGGVAAVTKFLQSKEGKKLQQEVVRGVFGLLKKKM